MAKHYVTMDINGNRLEVDLRLFYKQRMSLNSVIEELKQTKDAPLWIEHLIGLQNMLDDTYDILDGTYLGK